MTAQEMFEAIMKCSGKDLLKDKNGKYKNQGMQTRWKYFQLGWELSKKGQK